MSRRPARPSRRPSLRRLPVSRPTLRLRVGFLLIAMVFSVFAGRLVQLQGIDPDSYAEMAAEEGSVSVVLPATRGDILDRSGTPMAESVDGLMIIADPAVTSAWAPELARFLAGRLGVDYFATLERLRVEDSRFQYIARQVPATIARRVVENADKIAERATDSEERGWSGLRTENDPVRTYPGGDVAANLVGFLGTPRIDGSSRPAAGLEASFDEYLAGIDGEATYRTGSGARIPLGDSATTPAVDGQDLTTTIDQDLQWYVQRALQETVTGAGGESGYAVVMDTLTGELLSVADYPTYDARDPFDAPEQLYKSGALSDVYEPGSVEKVLTVSSLIDAGLVTDRTRFQVPGSLARQDRVIHDYWEHGLLRLTMAGIIAKSSNIGTVLAADQFERGQLRRYLEAYGLGAQTQLGVPGETAGILPQGSAWTSQAEDRIAFGQSLSVNAIQMTTALNTIANGGVRIDPSLVLGSATTDGGTEVGTDDAEETRVVSEEAARQTMRMMERVIDPEAGVAPGAAVPGYRVAGKTGTAQRVGPEGTYDGTFTVSFGGFAPADDPRFTVYVVVQDPNGGGGGSVAGPAFSKIMGFVLRHYQVAPTDTRPSRLPVEW